MTKQTNVNGTDEAWETGALGRDEEFVRVSDDVDSNAIDEALELQMISIRLQKSLIEDFKKLGKLNGIGYQPLMRQALMRFAEGEKRMLLTRAVNQAAQEMTEAREVEEEQQQTACG